MMRFRFFPNWNLFCYKPKVSALKGIELVGFLEVISRASLKMAVDKWTWKEKKALASGRRINKLTFTLIQSYNLNSFPLTRLWELGFESSAPRTARTSRWWWKLRRGVAKSGLAILQAWASVLSWRWKARKSLEYRHRRLPRDVVSTSSRSCRASAGL